MNDSKSRKIRVTAWITYGIALGLGSVVVGFIVLWVAEARDRTMRTQSKNNLKQIGLGLLNYHDVFKRLPPGGTLNPQNQPHHGWATSILPFLEANPMYSYIDMNLTWDDPLNQHIFRFPYRPYKNPLIPIEFESNGYAISHYSGNEQLLNVNRSIKLDELKGDLANTWMVQELYDHWHPWGSALNFSELNWPTRHYQANLKWRNDGLQLVMADGSVSYFDKTTDDSRMDSLKKASQN